MFNFNGNKELEKPYIVVFLFWSCKVVQAFIVYPVNNKPIHEARPIAYPSKFNLAILIEYTQLA
jgi:hypothetical protein